MKLRLKGNTLRLRLTRPEVERLLEQREVAERTEFPSQQALEYRVVSDAGAGAISAQLEGTSVTVRIPAAAVREWATTEQVTLRAEQANGSGDALGVLVEKDFACLVEREGEDDSEAFAHPRAGGC